MEIKTVREGVENIFARKKEICPPFEVEKRERYPILHWEGKSAPVLVARSYTKWRRFKNNPALGAPCAVTGYYAGPESLETILFREFDLCQWWMNSRIVRVASYISGNSANVLLSFARGTTATLQLHAAAFGTPQFKHEFFTTSGSISDRAVDTLIAQGALNVFTAEGHETYTDADILTYGLTEGEVDEAYAIYNLIHNDNPNDEWERVRRLDRVVDAALCGDGIKKEGVDF